ncbi:MAG: hypothetical protein ACKPDI_15925 [Actinomycetota bacterium]
MQVTRHDSARPSVAGLMGRGRFVLRHRIVAFLLVGTGVAGVGVAAASAQSVDPAATPKAYVMSDLSCTDGTGSLLLTLVNDGDSALATFRFDAAPHLDMSSVVVAPGGRETVLMAGLEDGQMGFPVEVDGAVEHVQATVACGADANRATLGTRVHHMPAAPPAPAHEGTARRTALLGALLVLAGSTTAWVVRRRYAVAERSF